MNPIESPWNAVLAASLRGSALILCVLAVRWLLRGRLPAQAVHLLWLLVAVRLVLPPGLIARLSDGELRFVLLHELAHVRRHDLAALWLLTAARVLHWFNPLAWLAAHLARGDAELACDETVLRHAREAEPAAYGAALLRLVQLAPWRPAAVPMAGIAERAGALRERLARIADYAPGTVRRTVFTALVVLGVGVVFGADEKPDTAPAPAPSPAPTTAAPEAAPVAAKPPGEPPAWVQGWSVARVVIPADGEIKNAFVDLLQPDGKTVTLYPGQQTKDGVLLSNVELAWSPARARVWLRSGTERAEISAAAALISKSETLKRAAVQVLIEARFIEMPEALALTLKDPAGNLLFPAAAKGSKPAPLGAVAGVFTEKQMPAFLAKLPKMKGVDLLSTPKVVTRSGQRAVIEIIREFKYPVTWKKNENKEFPWIADEFEVRNVGVTLEIEPILSMEGTLDIQLTPQVVEHLGWVDVETGKPVKSLSSATKIQEAGALTGVPQPVSSAAVDAELFKSGSRTSILQPASYGSGRIRPVFSGRKATASVSIESGNSVIFSDLPETEDTKPFKPKTPGRRLIVIITARQMNDSGVEGAPR